MAKRKKRHIRVRAVRREHPDLRRLSKALIAVAMAQAEQEAQAQHETGVGPPPTAKPTQGAGG